MQYVDVQVNSKGGNERGKIIDEKIEILKKTQNPQVDTKAKKNKSHPVFLLVTLVYLNPAEVVCYCWYED